MKRQFTLEVECRWNVGDHVSFGYIGKIVEIGIIPSDFFDEELRGTPGYKIQMYNTEDGYHTAELAEDASWYTVENVNKWNASEQPVKGGPLVVNPREMSRRECLDVWILGGPDGLTDREIADVLKVRELDPGEVISFKVVDRGDERFLVLWWDRADPADDEIDEFIAYQNKWEAEQEK